MRATGDVDFHAPFGFTPISWYAMDAARYIHEFNSSREELVPLRSDYDWLISSQSRMGRSLGATRT
jgi:hypothetical protein